MTCDALRVVILTGARTYFSAVAVSNVHFGCCTGYGGLALGSPQLLLAKHADLVPTDGLAICMYLPNKHTPPGCPAGGHRLGGAFLRKPLLIFEDRGDLDHPALSIVIGAVSARVKPLIEFAATTLRQPCSELGPDVSGDGKFRRHCASPVTTIADIIVLSRRGTKTKYKTLLLWEIALFYMYLKKYLIAISKVSAQWRNLARCRTNSLAEVTDV